MSTEPEHLTRLRSSLEAVQSRGDDPTVLRQAVEALLRIAVAHHETAGLGVPEEEVPPFMETGEPVTIPTAM